MALIKSTPTAVSFESEEETTNAASDKTTAGVTDPKPTAAPSPAAASVSGTPAGSPAAPQTGNTGTQGQLSTPPKSDTAAVAVAPQRAVSKLANTVSTLDAAQDAIHPDALQEISYGVFPKITVNSGGTFTQDKTKLLGGLIKIKLESWSLVWYISHGKANAADADNKKLRTTYGGEDGLLNDGSGKTAQSYLKQLKTEGYENAVIKKYLEIYGGLIQYRESVGDDSKVIVVPAGEEKLVQVSVSPQSVGKWQAFLLQARMNKSNRNIDTPLEIVIRGGTKTIGPNTFGVMEFASK